jgi:thiamine-phosphate pyrophosphorylase
MPSNDLGAERRERLSRARLYMVCDATPARHQLPDLLRAAAAGGVEVVQLRDKRLADDELSSVADAARALCERLGLLLIVNDRPAVAAEAGADGVHVGQDDMPYAEARRIVGPDRQIGVTCKASRDLAMTAGEAGADYVAFGAFFPSSTKTVTTPASLEIIEWWSELFEIPCVAIGGITVENCKPVIAAGADFLAVAGGVWNHKDGPEAAVRAFNEIFVAR